MNMLAGINLRCRRADRPAKLYDRLVDSYFANSDFVTGSDAIAERNDSVGDGDLLAGSKVFESDDH